MHPLIREVQKGQLRKIPEIRPGYTLRIQQKITEIKEGEKGEKEVRERLQAFEGLVIKVGHGEGVEKSIIVRKVVEGVGVEKLFLLHSPGLEKIEVKKKGDVRRSKLYYMRHRSGKSARMKETQVSDADRAAEEAKIEALLQEAIAADTQRREAEAASVAAKTAEVSAADAPFPPHS